MKDLAGLTLGTAEFASHGQYLSSTKTIIYTITPGSLKNTYQLSSYEYGVGTATGDQITTRTNKP